MACSQDFAELAAAAVAQRRHSRRMGKAHRQLRGRLNLAPQNLQQQVGAANRGVSSLGARRAGHEAGKHGHPLVGMPRSCTAPPAIWHLPERLPAQVPAATCAAQAPTHLGRGGAAAVAVVNPIGVEGDEGALQGVGSGRGVCVCVCVQGRQAQLLAAFSCLQAPKGWV
jgi:hypothetical protein